MPSPSLTHKLTVVQKLLDFGVTVEIEGMEYIQAHNLFIRAKQTNPDGSVEARPLQYPNDRYSMLNLVSKMTDDEFIIASSTSALNDGFRGRKSVIEMIYDAVKIYKENCGKIIYINECISPSGQSICLDTPVSVVLKDESHDFPISIIAPEIFEFGQNINEIDTQYSFKQVKQKEEGRLPNDCHIYGSQHSYDGHIIVPKFNVKKSPEITNELSR